MEYHELADLFPMMEQQEFTALCDDIAKYGVIEPIVTHEGKILDGRNRYEACIKTDQAPVYKEWAGEAGTPLQFVISVNLNRRHLDSGQRACIAQDVLPLFEEQAKERQGARSDLGKKFYKSNGRATDDAAKLFNTNHVYVNHAKKLKTERPDLFDDVKDGKLKLNKAVNDLKRDDVERISHNYKIPFTDTDKTGQYGLLAVAIVKQAIRDLRENPKDINAKEWLQGDVCKLYCDWGGVSYGMVSAWIEKGHPVMVDAPAALMQALDAQVKRSRKAARFFELSEDDFDMYVDVPVEVVSLDEMAEKEDSYTMDFDADRF